MFYIYDKTRLPGQGSSRWGELLRVFWNASFFLELFVFLFLFSKFYIENGILETRQGYQPLVVWCCSMRLKAAWASCSLYSWIAMPVRLACQYILSLCIYIYTCQHIMSLYMYIYIISLYAHRERQAAEHPCGHTHIARERERERERDRERETDSKTDALSHTYEWVMSH